MLAAIGSAIVGLFAALRDRVPALQRFSAGMLTAFAAVIVVAVVGVGFALGGRGGSDAPATDVQMGDEAAQTEQSQEATNPANPDEPADLVWRDADFAVDPSFHEWTNKDNGRKVVYLTVDDGPSFLTEKYLDLFDQYNVKATFFVTGQNPEYYPMIREAYNRGHTIGLHSMSHDYAKIYSSEDEYYKDLDEVGQLVKEQIGYVPCFIRFPGGSSNTIAEGYSQGLMSKLVKGVVARGYQYYDWSLASGDGEDRSAAELVSISTASNDSTYDPTKDTNIMLLCHDSNTKQTTYDALPKIIEFYQSKGYSFEAIDRNTWTCHHTVYNAEPEPTEDEEGSESDYEGEETADEYGEDAYAEGEEAYTEESDVYVEETDEGSEY